MKRLRALPGDALFVRTAHAIEPTPRAAGQAAAQARAEKMSRVRRSCMGGEVGARSKKGDALTASTARKRGLPLAADRP